MLLLLSLETKRNLVEPAHKASCIWLPSSAWFSRYVLTWQLSNTLDGYFCLDALHQALIRGRPVIFNPDPGAQFTANDLSLALNELLCASIWMVVAVLWTISSSDRMRAVGQRLWRSLKYENIYLNDYASVPELAAGLAAYFLLL